MGPETQPSQETQARAYEGLFDYWNSISYMQGVYLWNWEANPNARGLGATSYTPQNKQAEEVMVAWWKAGNWQDDPTQGPPDPKDPEDDPIDEDLYEPENVPHNNFDIDVRKTTENPVVSESVHFDVAIRNKGATAHNVIVNVEILNSEGSRVHQTFYNGQDIHSDSRLKYDVRHTFDKAGTYVVKVSVVGAGRSDLWIWDDVVYTQYVKDIEESEPLDPEPKPSPIDNRQYHTWRLFKHPVFGENHSALRVGYLPTHAAHVAHHKAKVSAVSSGRGTCSR